MGKEQQNALGEQIHRYREIRSVLAQLVRNLTGASERIRLAALQAARAYMHGHCAECGAALEQQDYALVHAQEVQRIGATASEIAELPICPNCYEERCAVRQHFAPADEPEQDA